MKVFIDLDSGTVLNGPIYAVDIAHEDFLAFALDNDEDARAYAREHGTEVSA